MDILNNIYGLTNEKSIRAGSLLIAEPFLQDPNFARTVIFICEHNDDGTVGFVLNNPTDITLGDLLPEQYSGPVPINKGGPVELNTLHMLHTVPQELGGNEIAPGIYWGGSYEKLRDVVSETDLHEEDMKLFLGYSGWTGGQLQKELEEGSWLVADASKDLLFGTASNQLWKNAIYSMGKQFEILANMPIHPQLN